MEKSKEQHTHAAGSGSSTGDPGKARGTGHPVQTGACGDDHIESAGAPPAPEPNPPAVH